MHSDNILLKNGIWRNPKCTFISASTILKKKKKNPTDFIWWWLAHERSCNLAAPNPILAQGTKMQLQEMQEPNNSWRPMLYEHYAHFDKERHLSASLRLQVKHTDVGQ